MKKIILVKTNKQGFVAALLTLSLLWLTGCQSGPSMMVKPDDPEFAPVPSESLIPPPAQGGSIFNQGYGLQLYSDKKARTAGDIITILLDERTVSKKSSKANTSKSSSAALSTPIVMGSPLQIGKHPISGSLSGDRDFQGSGAADQSNSLQGSITVTVSEILPNGILKVRGEKWMTLNQGDEYIRIQGLLRPEDIALDNTVSSEKLADARISYSGTGSLANSSKSGWLSNIFNSGWFPY